MAGTFSSQRQVVLEAGPVVLTPCRDTPSWGHVRGPRGPPHPTAWVAFGDTQGQAAPRRAMGTKVTYPRDPASPAPPPVTWGGQTPLQPHPGAGGGGTGGGDRDRGDRGRGAVGARVGCARRGSSQRPPSPPGDPGDPHGYLGLSGKGGDTDATVLLAPTASKKGQGGVGVVPPQ